jgi:hypothetical protein
MNIERTCTCHSDDNPPTPCAKHYALTECKSADYDRLCAELEEMRNKLKWIEVKASEAHPSEFGVVLLQIQAKASDNAPPTNKFTK